MKYMHIIDFNIEDYKEETKMCFISYHQETTTFYVDNFSYIFKKLWRDSSDKKKKW